MGTALIGILIAEAIIVLMVGFSSQTFLYKMLSIALTMTAAVLAIKGVDFYVQNM